MQELLVLGLVPGTNIQITFGAWVVVMCILAGVFFTNFARREHLFASLIITAYLVQQTRQIRA